MSIFGNKKTSTVESFSSVLLRTAGMRATNEYEIVPKNGEAEVTLYNVTFEKGGEARVPRLRAVCRESEIIDLLNACGVVSWDGFEGKHPRGVLDGVMFRFKATVNGNVAVTAHGSQNFPRHYREFTDALYNILTSRAPAAGVNTVEILGSNRRPEFSQVRVACRAFIEREGKLLISHEVNTDIMLTPGGGLENGESLEECCRREVAEETGFEVEVGAEAARVIEYYGDHKFDTHYFICTVTGSGEPKLTELESEHGLVSLWADKNDLARIWSEYGCYPEEKRGAYLREYKALEEYFRFTGDEIC